jgi:hypothetical protein
MAFTFDPNTLDFHGDEKRDASQAVFTAAFSNPELAELHEIIEDIVVDTQIPIIGGLNNQVGLGDNSCEQGREDNSIPMSQKKWTPKPISGRLPFCWKTLEPTFWAWGLKAGLEKADLEGSEFINFIGEKLVEKLKEMLLRVSYFSNTTIDTITNGGILTNGTPLAYFNKIDGFFAQIDAIIAADSTRLTSSILTTRNAAATYALQAFTATDTTNRVVTKALQEVRFGADMRLRASETLRYEVTLSVADQYERELLAAEIPYSVERMENGVKVLKSAGIELIVLDFLDRMKVEFFNDGTRIHEPHVIILSTKTNMPVATQNAGTFTEYSVLYDPIEKEILVDFATELDAKIIEDHMIQVAK